MFIIIFIPAVGPLVISCDDGHLYLVPSEDGTHIKGTESRDDAVEKPFWISYDEDGQGAFEFSIQHCPGDKGLEGLKQVSRYVDADVNMMGRNPEPLQLKQQADSRHTSMTLHSRRTGRRTGRFDPVDISDWRNSNDVFYICCKQRSYGRGSYICVMKRPNDPNDRNDKFPTCCVSAIAKPSETNKCMLFRLEAI